MQEPLSVLGTDFLAHILNKVGGPVAEGAIGLDSIAFTAGGDHGHDKFPDAGFHKTNASSANSKWWYKTTKSYRVSSKYTLTY